MAELKPCGTHAAYYRHRRRGEPACPPCLAAHSAYTTAWEAANPRKAGQPRKRRQPLIVSRLEDYRELRSWGVTRAEAAARLGRSYRTITRYDQRLREQQTA
jgi:hypothetical protein